MSKRIAIVGGGPGGSATALSLIEEGVEPSEIVIFDKACFPRGKLCGGAVTARGTEALLELLGERPKGGAVTEGIDFRYAEERLVVRERCDSWVYLRSELDAQLLGACRERGVEVREGCAVKALSPGHEALWVETEAGRGTGREAFEWVVGADGVAGPCRRSAGLPKGRLGRLIEGVYELAPGGGPPDLDPRQLYFDFDPILAGIPGYAWIFPFPEEPERGETRRFKIGLMDARGEVSGKDLRAYLSAFAETYGFVPTEEKVAGWPERYFHPGARAHRPGLVLVGDAYGIDPLLGEGIAPALFQARYAARRIRGAMDKRSRRGSDSRRLPAYELGFLATEEGSNLSAHAVIAELVYGPGHKRWIPMLYGIPRIRELAEAGGDRYGRLLRRLPSFAASFLLYLLREGVGERPAEPKIRLPDPAHRRSAFGRVGAARPRTA